MNKTARSYLMFISSMLIYGTIGIFRRYIPISSALLAFIRGGIGAVCLCAFTKLSGHKIRNGIGKKKLALLALSGAVMGFNWILLFESYNYTTVATATLCYYMAPTIIILVSPFLLHEKLTTRKLLCALAAVVGMVFVSGILNGENTGADNLKGILFGLGAAVFYSTVIIMNKKVDIASGYEKSIIQLASAAVVLIPYMLIIPPQASAPLTAVSVILIAVVGIIHTGLAYALYFSSMPAMKAQSIAVLSYIDPVSALLLSVVFLHESMTVFSVIGAVLIVGSALISELQHNE